MQYSQSEAGSQLNENINRVDKTPESAIERLRREPNVFGDMSSKEAMKRRRAQQYELAHGGRVGNSLALIEKNIQDIRSGMESEREERERWRTEFNQQIDLKIESTLNQSFNHFRSEWDKERRDIMNMVEVLNKGKGKLDSKLEKMEEKLENLLNIL